MADENVAPPTISWARAILSAVAIAVVSIALLVYAPNAVLTKVHGKTHGSLVAVATTMFFVVLFLLAWALRRLQRRHLI